MAQRAILASVLCIAVLSPCAFVFGQGGRASSVPAGAKVNPDDPTKKPLDTRGRFVYDVVRSAVALPQTEPADRLRVLVAASTVISPIRPALARAYSREGLRVEQDLIQKGEQPDESILSAGPVDCKAVQVLVESIPAQRVDAAETSLLAAIEKCHGTTVAAQKLIDAGLQEKKIAPRATMGLMERVGLKSAWSQDKFQKLFDSLPSDASTMLHDAPNLATFYARTAGEVDHALAKKAGVRLLLWLGKLEPGGDRTVAVNVTTGAMKQVLGAKDYEDALSGDLMARQVAESAGGQGEISRPMDESASVLKAMQSAKDDRLGVLEGMPPSQRAREAAASGFASGTAGDRKLAGRYFDLAFSSLNSVWSDRKIVRNAPDIVQEVSEAAAQVDAMDALLRVKGLDDSAAQAIGMISVARVVSGKEQPTATSASR